MLNYGKHFYSLVNKEGEIKGQPLHVDDTNENCPVDKVHYGKQRKTEKKKIINNGLFKA